MTPLNQLLQSTAARNLLSSEAVPGRFDNAWCDGDLEDEPPDNNPCRGTPQDAVMIPLDGARVEVHRF